MSHYTGSMQCWLSIQQHDISIQKMTVNLQSEELSNDDNDKKAKTFAKENSQKNKNTFSGSEYEYICLFHMISESHTTDFY